MENKRQSNTSTAQLRAIKKYRLNNPAKTVELNQKYWNIHKDYYNEKQRSRYLEKKEIRIFMDILL
jgi:hypothetical protein